MSEQPKPTSADKLRWAVTEVKAFRDMLDPDTPHYKAVDAVLALLANACTDAGAGYRGTKSYGFIIKCYLCGAELGTEESDQHVKDCPIPLYHAVAETLKGENG